jgi:hypothetical protein
MITTYERGYEQGVLQGERQLTLRQLEAKFGPLSAEVKRQVEALAPKRLAEVQLELLTAPSLKALGLED